MRAYSRLSLLPWFALTFLSLTGTSTLAMTTVLDNPMSPQQFGDAVGAKAIWLVPISALIVAIASGRGWLPGACGKGPR
jgi:hypothetical protein